MKPAIALFVLITLVTGCDQLREVGSGLDNKTEPTYWFWARLQGVEYRGLPEVRRLTVAARDAAQSYDVDKTADAFRQAGQEHARLADELGRLDPADVDDEATAYRERLVMAHRAVAEIYTSYARSTSDRDGAALEADQPKLKRALEAYAATWNDRNAVMANLKRKYSRNFDVQE